MIFSGIARIIVIIVGVVYAGANRILEGTPVNRVTIWSMIYVALYLDSFARIYLFDTNRITSTKKSSGSASTNNSKTLSSKVSRTDLTSPEN
jgi:membrane-bound ClpP family serine protease